MAQALASQTGQSLVNLMLENRLKYLASFVAPILRISDGNFLLLYRFELKPCGTLGLIRERD